jgi:hypothetical protein
LDPCIMRSEASAHTTTAMQTDIFARLITAGLLSWTFPGRTSVVPTNFDCQLSAGG